LDIDRLFLSYLHFHFVLIYYLRTYYPRHIMEPIDDVIPSEQIAFIAYNIGVYESVQKFGSLITSGKIKSGTDVSKMAELLSQSTAFYDADMIAGLINAMLHHTEGSTVKRVKPEHVRYVISQLKVTGVSLP
jgi:hypothetical protein